MVYFQEGSGSSPMRLFVVVSLQMITPARAENRSWLMFRSFNFLRSATKSYFVRYKYCLTACMFIVLLKFYNFVEYYNTSPKCEQNYYHCEKGKKEKILPQ